MTTENDSRKNLPVDRSPPSCIVSGMKQQQRHQQWQQETERVSALIRACPKEQRVPREVLLAVWKATRTEIRESLKDRIRNPRPYRDPPKLLTG